MMPSLKQVLPVPMQEELLTPSVQAHAKKRIGTLKELLEAHPEFKEILVDATEQDVPKPKDKLARKQRYSGKKKQHTLKSQVAVSNRLVLHLSKHVPGCVHDYILLRATGVVYTLQAQKRKLRVDKGYEGIEDAYPDADIAKPKRAQRNHKLNPLEKLYNQLLNSLRIPVEHTLAFLQKFGILAGIYRGPTHRYDDTFLVVAGLSNFRKMNSLTW
jgi:DDE superfamily endonuclease